MNIFYCVRDLTQIHSCIYNMYLLKQLGHNVIPVLGVTNENLNSVLLKNNITPLYFSLSKSIAHWKYFLRVNYCFFKNIRKGLKGYKKGDLIVMGTADSALYGYPVYLKKRFAICLLEMHENQPILQKFLKYICGKASAVICCEINRARYAQFRWGLKKRPFVISNKPYGFPCVTDSISEQSRNVISQLKGKKSILYQAWHIHQTDVICNLLKALSMVNNDVVLVIMGIVDSCVDKAKLEQIYSNIIWAGHIPAPKHLEVTKNIDIGVAMYSETSLNNMFCAPNKTFEYSSYGKPILCNNIPGLVETVGLNKAGACVNWNNPKDIATGIITIFNDYEVYTKNAINFYKKEDNLEVMRCIIDDISE